MMKGGDRFFHLGTAVGFWSTDLEGSVMSGLLDGFGAEVMVEDLVHYAGRDGHNKPCINRGRIIEVNAEDQKVCVLREARSSMHSSDDIPRRVWVPLSKVGRISS
jgi:hypothetical protein